MNWLIGQAKRLYSWATCSGDSNIHEQDTEETEPAVVEDPCPSDEKLAEMRMPELRGLAASRDLGDGRYKGVNRANLTELIKQSYQK